MNTKKSILGTLLIGTFFLFQNCGDSVSFDSQPTISGSESGQGTGNGSDQDDSNDGQGTPGNPSDNNTPGSIGGGGNGGNPLTPTIVTPPTPVTGNVIRDEIVDFTSCQAFQEIQNTGTLINIPVPTAQGICYYIKLFNNISSHRSGSQNEVRDPEVLASNHNGNYGSYISPYSMGDASVEFTNVGNWKTSLSGAFNDPTVKMAIDNFFLVQLTYGLTDRVELNSAWGTADAEPGSGQLPILYKDLALDFTSFAPGGTALVEAIGVELPGNLMPSQAGNLDLRVRALDCGGSAQLREVYLVFH